MIRIPRRLFALVIAALVSCKVATAEPWLPPGNTQLRLDLQWLNDAGVIDMPGSTWPLSWGDVHSAIAGLDGPLSETGDGHSLSRVKSNARWASAIDDPLFFLGLSLADSPRFIRSFENTPRDEAEVMAGFTWMGEVFAVNLNASLVKDSIDGDEFFPDGTYLGIALGNWMISAGWQERWWGPGHDGSLILSTNSRPNPGISIQRNRSMAFESKWLSWIGPWSITSFMNLLDDDREVDDALLFGLRVAFKPVASLEIGLSRTAQWCGDGRPCDFEAFGNMLLGKDNQGVNVDPDEEPGNQLAGFDVRWALPKDIPVALYMQWVGEDGRDEQAIPGSWLRQFGVEFWGTFGDSNHRTHFEVSDTACHEGGFGFSDIKPDCAYEHSIYQTGYRYKQKSMGHGIDGDGLSYSLGSTFVRSRGRSWNLLLRYMEINRVGTQGPTHTISTTSQELADIQLTHNRVTSIGRFYFGLGYSRLDDDASETTTDDVEAFLQWSTQ
jgi:hypothetical protein